MVWGSDYLRGHELDITYERFTDMLVSEHIGKHADKTANLVLFLGSNASLVAPVA
jgi:hypothetical protein